MSPLLFKLYTAELEERLKRKEIVGIIVGKFKFWNLAYANDVVLIAKNREAIQDMMSTLKEFLKDRQLALNVEKSKVLVFNKNRDKKEK